MAKTKRNYIPPEMQARLRVNRDGKMTTDQWKDMVTEPLVILMLLMVPIVIFFGPRLIALSARGLIYVFFVVILVIGVPMLLRARRYARSPVRFDRLFSGSVPQPSWMSWRPTILYTSTGEPVKFKRRLAPYMALEPNSPYLVYYLNEPKENVLLSMAPAEHEKIEQWQPTKSFELRQAQRSKH
ncbi:MAG: hypothetical protein K8L99_24785 [Anaerolineae bacterium]|nr:hypothetical protein [Anaerolineae bacterium]